MLAHEVVCRGDEEEKREGGEGRKTYRAKRAITAVASQYSMVKKETASRKEGTWAMVVVKLGSDEENASWEGAEGTIPDKRNRRSDKPLLLARSTTGGSTQVD
jgi:predicted amidohydrolase YtcJ